jgi:hypothetical protein
MNALYYVNIKQSSEKFLSLQSFLLTYSICYIIIWFFWFIVKFLIRFFIKTLKTCLRNFTKFETGLKLSFYSFCYSQGLQMFWKISRIYYYILCIMIWVNYNSYNKAFLFVSLYDVLIANKFYLLHSFLF